VYTPPAPNPRSFGARAASVSGEELTAKGPRPTRVASRAGPDWRPTRPPPERRAEKRCTHWREHLSGSAGGARVASRHTPSRGNYWTRIGVGYENHDGSFNLRFDYLPADLNGTTVQLRDFQRRDGADDEGSSDEGISAQPF
jgi:hypothetical protein